MRSLSLSVDRHGFVGRQNHRAMSGLRRLQRYQRSGEAGARLMEMYEIGLPPHTDSDKRLNNLLLQPTVTSVDTVAAEVERSTKIHGDFQSLHEGYAVF